MKVLLDTHTVLWLMNDFEKLSPKVEDMVILTADENIHKYDVITLW